jgi:hypothetical protein
LLWLLRGEGDILYGPNLLPERYDHPRILEEVEHGPVAPIKEGEVDAGPADTPEGGPVQVAALDVRQIDSPVEEAEL